MLNNKLNIIDFHCCGIMCEAASYVRAQDNFYGVKSWNEWPRNFQPYGLEAAEYFEKETSLP